MPTRVWSLVRRILRHAARQAREQGLLDGARVVAGALRAMGQRPRLVRLLRIPAFARLLDAQPQADALFFFSHRHFLSRELGAAGRLACALDHFRFEDARLQPSLVARLHGTGLLLWQDGQGHEIRLAGNARTRHEGPLSLRLMRGGQVLHELSFAVVASHRLGADAGQGPVLFATRHQSLAASRPAQQAFRAHFPQNTPAYFALAALQGVALALGYSRFIGVRAECQIAFEALHAVSFGHAYDEFWQNFGGRRLSGHGFELPVPVPMTPLDQLKAKHRARARQRREHWRQIAESAQAALRPHLRPVVD